MRKIVEFNTYEVMEWMKKEALKVVTVGESEAATPTIKVEGEAVSFIVTIEEVPF